MSSVTEAALSWTEQGLIPDTVIRAGIRRLLRERLASITHGDCEAMADAQAQFLAEMADGPIAPLSHKANEQHYEVPAAFFEKVLGPHRKYSCAYWHQATQTLAEAEAAALSLTCDRAQLADGQKVLELGCGWGSLTLWMAQHYPNSTVYGVSNSHSQREFIEAQAQRRGLQNVRVITCDMNSFATGEQFDRIVSVEMFEHMRNYGELLRRVSTWLTPGGRFFMHIFVHRSTPYPFEDHEAKDWMTRYFFSGGMMPSDDLPLFFQDHLRFLRRWRWSGTHYERTANAWLANMDDRRDELWPLLEQVYGAEDAATWWNRWRVFFMACAELWGYENGQQWWVGHYLFENRG